MNSKWRYVKLLLWYEMVILGTMGVITQLFYTISQAAIVVLVVAWSCLLGVFHALARHTETKDEKPQWNMVAWYLITMSFTSWVTSSWLHYCTIPSIFRYLLMAGLAALAAAYHVRFSADTL